MRLATLAVENPETHSDAHDGRLIVVSQDGKTACTVEQWPTLLSAIQEWQVARPTLEATAESLAAGEAESFSLEGKKFRAPLPRTFAWLDGSAFIQHILLVRKARGAEPPEDLKTVPLMYQGASDNLLGPNDDMPLVSEEHGMDFESEVAVVLDNVPLGTTAAEAGKYIKLILLMNDISLRRLIPRELKAGFGFFHGKPPSTFAPFAVTPDEFGDSWKEGRLHLEMRSTLNGKLFGHPNAGPEMFFSFHELIAHAAKTRPLSAGTILGSGTVSNKDESVGSSCLAEKRMIETIKTGAATTSFMKMGDRIEVEILHEGRSIFGRIDQKVAPAKVPASA
jgi:fumarylacetoacetate (FAA) hydrolase